jgi:hypothetical protein
MRAKPIDVCRQILQGTPARSKPFELVAGSLLRQSTAHFKPTLTGLDFLDAGRPAASTQGGTHDA